MPGIGARSDETIRHEASDWVAQVHDPDAAVDRAAFERWRSADPRHGQAYARAERAWDQAAFVAQTSFGRARRLPARRRWFEGTQTRYAFAAAAVLVIALVGLTVIRPFGASVERTELASRVGEIRKVALADGSIVTLDTDSQLRVSFSPAERDLVLMRGRARFDVAHDAGRPFVVTAAGASVTARGTIFDISLSGGNVKVALLRGSVDVRGSNNVGHAPSGTIARLKPGQQVAFVSSTSPPSPQPAESGASEWTGGMLSFDRTRLGDAIVEANRYSTDKIAVADPALNDLRITGAYHVGDAQGLAASMPVVWVERVMRAESAGLTTLGGRPITSRAGAMGLMQLMPATWAMMRTQLALGGDPHDPRDNILAGACYLRAMYDRFGYPGLFAAYNAGPGRYAEHLATGSVLPGETRVYLAKLTGNDAGSVVASAASSVSIFFALRTSPTAAEPRAEARPSGIFVTLGSEASPR